MKKFTAQQITEASADAMLIVNGGINAKAGRDRLDDRFAAMRDRQSAIVAACAIMDDMKASGKVGATVTGKKLVETIVNGVSHTTEKEVRNDTTSNAKAALAGSVNRAYPGYPDKVRLVTHKTDATTYKLAKVKVADKIKDAADNLANLLNLSPAERQDIDNLVARVQARRVEDAHADALSINAAIDERAAQRAADKEHAAIARTEAITRQVATLCEQQGVKASEKAKIALIQSTVETMFSTMPMQAFN